MAGLPGSLCLSLGLILAAIAFVRPNEASQTHRGGSGAAPGAAGGSRGRHAPRSRGAFSWLGTQLKGEVERNTVQEASKEEIMAHMTVEKAYSTFMSMNHSLDSHLTALIQSEFGHTSGRKGGKSLRRIQEHGVSHKYDRLSGLYTARDLLNEMMDETITNKEVETEKCENYESNQMRLIWESQQDIDYANAQAADARAAALRSQQTIAAIQDVKIPGLENELQQNKERCDSELGALRGQLALVASDMNVLREVFSHIDCEDVDHQLPEPLASDMPLSEPMGLLQFQGSHAGGKADDGALLQCPPCATGGKPVFHVRHSLVQAQLQKLKSEVAKEYVREHLQQAFAETERLHPSNIRRAVLVQEGAVAAVNRTGAWKELPGTDGLAGAECGSELMGDTPKGVAYRGCTSQTIQGYECQKWTSMAPHNTSRFANQTEPGNEFGLGDHNYCRNPTPEEKHTIWCYTNDPKHAWGYCLPLEVVPAPDGVIKHECVLTGECKLAHVNCQKLRDGDLTILAGVIDKHSQLSDDIARVEAECKKIHEDITGAIQSFNVQITQEQTALATATKKIQEATNAENLASMAHTEYVNDYHEQMKKCCDNKNGFLAELCSLEKLRGELFRMEGEEATIIDCEVADWTDSQCTAACAGGTQERSRSIVAHTVNGTQCPPMRQERDCNTQSCPIDCKVGIWSEWTECTAMCGGGVRTRMRELKVRPKYDGEPCPDLQETEECNVGSCNEDCELGDWMDWTGCSKACDTGHRERRMAVTTEARGSGKCSHPDSEERLNQGTCNTHTCLSMVPDTSPFLRCQSKLDLVILMDSSGSLSGTEFQQAKLMVKTLLSNMVSGEEGMKVAFLMYGGPTTLEAYDLCAGGDAHAQPDAQSDCGMHWVAHLTANTTGIADRVAALPHTLATTMTSMALSQAKTELLNGRQATDSVVMVITDAKPMSYMKTGKAAQDVKESSRLIWVPIGPTMPQDLEHLKTWASRPWEDSVVPVPDVTKMLSPEVQNSIIASLCPGVQEPVDLSYVYLHSSVDNQCLEFSHMAHLKVGQCTEQTCNAAAPPAYCQQWDFSDVQHLRSIRDDMFTICLTANTWKVTPCAFAEGVSEWQFKDNRLVNPNTNQCLERDTATDYPEVKECSETPAQLWYFTKTPNGPAIDVMR